MRSAAPFKKPRHTPSAFSLVEVIVVLAIILIVLAVMIPSYGMVKKRTRTMSCMNNLRQIGGAIMVYCADKGQFPYSSQFDYQADWGEALLPYMVPAGTMAPLIAGWASPGMNKLTDGSWQPVNRSYSQHKYNYFTCPAGPPPIQGYPDSFTYPHNYSCNEFIMSVNYHKRYMDVDGAPGILYGSDYLPPAATPSQLARPGSIVLICDSGVQQLLKDFNGDGQPDSLGDSGDTIGAVTGTIVADFYFNPDTASSRGDLAVSTPVDYEPVLGSEPGTTTPSPSDAWPVYVRHQGYCNALMADGHVQQFRNGELQRRNFASNARGAMMGPGTDPALLAYINIEYP